MKQQDRYGKMLDRELDSDMDAFMDQLYKSMEEPRAAMMKALDEVGLECLKLTLETGMEHAVSESGGSTFGIFNRSTYKAVKTETVLTNERREFLEDKLKQIK